MSRRFADRCATPRSRGEDEAVMRRGHRGDGFCPTARGGAPREVTLIWTQCAHLEHSEHPVNVILYLLYKHTVYSGTDMVGCTLARRCTPLNNVGPLSQPPSSRRSHPPGGQATRPAKAIPPRRIASTKALKLAKDQVSGVGQYFPCLASWKWRVPATAAHRGKLPDL